jgi:hypothetical protein
MQANARIFTFALGFIHLILTMITDFPMGVFKIVPLRVHGFIELIVSVALLIIANLFRKSDDIASFYFYLVFAIVLFLVWVVTEYSNSAQVQNANNP